MDRQAINLEKGWQFAGPAENLEYALQKDKEGITVPHTWNKEDGANGKVYLRAKCWYFLDLGKIELEEKQEYWLEFDGSAIVTEVYLNQELLYRHAGGYTRFRVNLTEHLGAKNRLAISVDNRKMEDVYPQDADFTFFGGLYRPIRAILVPADHFSLGEYGSQGIHVIPKVKGSDGKLTVELSAEGDAASALVTTAGQCKEVAFIRGKARVEFLIPQVHLWNGRKDPYLYEAEAVLDSGDMVSVKYAFRTFSVDPEKGFFLNGESYPLRGVARHQDHAGVGSVLTEAMMEEDMAIMEEMGVNTIRLAHYPHCQYFYDLCDARGMIVWAEIPYISRHLTAGRQNTIDQMTELVMQCRNHPSIICWGLSNEITMLSEINEDLLENHKLLHDLCHRLDPERLTTIAHVNNTPMDSPIQKVADLRSYNIYFGWYIGELADNCTFLDRFHKMNPQLCVGISEYGADANPKFQSPNPEKGDYSESYQFLYHKSMLETIEARPYLWATHVWNMFDFGVAARNEGGNPGMNQKGLVTYDRKTRKDAYYLYKAHWSDQPFVHICGKRYVNRAEDTTCITVVSNRTEVILLVNGKEAAGKNGRYVFNFEVPMEQEMTVTAISGNLRDDMVIRKVAEADKTYKMESSGGVVNWFDQDSFRSGFCSIKDSTVSLVENPATHDKTIAFCEKMSPGFVFDKQLMKAFGGLPIEGMIRRNLATLTDEDVKEFNAFLQRTPRQL